MDLDSEDYLMALELAIVDLEAKRDDTFLANVEVPQVMVGKE